MERAHPQSDDDGEDGKRGRRRSAPFGRDASAFDRLPDELVVAVLEAVGSAAALASWSLTCARHRDLAAETSVWRRLCEAHFGPTLHEGFGRARKDWRWLYRAQSHVAAATGADVGAVALVGHGGSDWTYWGDTLDGLPHGYGLALRGPSGCHPPTRDGSRAATRRNGCYEGEWRMGRRCGRGASVDPAADGSADPTSPGGNTYEGEWRDDKRHGRGVACAPNGDRYDGEWRDGRFHGVGAYLSHSIVGPVGSDDTRAAVGPVSARYEGEFRDGVAHGYAVEMFDGGSSYQGWFAGAERCGYGVYRWPDGARHAGQWERGERCGFGARTYADGMCIRGEWRGNDAAGYVVCTHGRERYEGEWTSAHGSDGYGVFTCADGSRIRGTWRGTTCLRGTVSAHRPVGDRPCVPVDPCRACEVVASIATVNPDS